MNPATFDTIMKAMDAVDTLRHRESIVDTEVSAEERDRLLIEKLREAYAAQGMAVSEDVLKKSVASLNEKRFVYEPMKAGWQRSLATLYVRRQRYGKRALIASLIALSVIAVPTMFVKYQESIRIEHEQAAAKAFEDRLTKIIPDELERVTASALRAIGDAGLTDERAGEVHRRNADAKSALSVRNENLAESEIKAIDDIRKTTEAILVAKKLEQESKNVVSDARAAAKSPDAIKAVEAAISELQRASQAGNEGEYLRSKEKLIALVNEIRMPLTIKIVDREGVKSGVWRMKNRDPSTKQHYLVVEAFKTDGSVIPRPIRNAESGRTEDVTIWAVRVPESVYNTYAIEKKATGFIAERNIGTKKAGSLEIDWSIQTTGQTITNW